MASTIQARLDGKSQKALAALTRRLGWSPSKIVRESLQLLAACHVGKGSQKVIGIGKFSSGLPDLGSNKSHLQGFGK